MVAYQEKNMKEEITAAINAHGQWKERLREAIDTGKSEFNYENVAPDNNCAFGKWLYSLDASDKESALFQEIKQLHASFHETAANVLKLAVSGQTEEAKKLMSDNSVYMNTSSSLILALGRWKRSIVE